MDPRIQYCVTQIEHKILHDSNEFNTHDALIQELAHDMRMTRFHLARLFLKDFNHSPRDYIQRNLMGRCALMIAHTSQSMFSIAIDMGFSSQQAFTRAFTRYWGISPHQFRQAHSIYIARRNQRAAEGGGVDMKKDIVVSIRTLPQIRFWAVRYEGLSTQKHVCWNDFERLFRQLPPEMSGGPFFGLTYDMPMFVPKPFIRYYCGVLAGSDPALKPREAFEITLPAGQIATTKAECNSYDVSDLYDQLLDSWLPHSGYSLRASCLAERFDRIPLHWDTEKTRIRLGCWIH